MFDPNIIKTIVAVVVILLDVAVVGIGVVYLLFGMLFGTRKSLRRALSFIIPFAIFILCLNFLTNIILNAKVGGIFGFEENLSLKQFVISMLSDLLADSLYNGNIDAAINSEINVLATSLATTVIRLVIYLVGLFVIVFFIAPFIRFITWLSYRIQIKGTPKEKMRWASRIGGMGIASVRYLIFIFVLILPLSGGLSTIKMLVEDANLAISVIDEQEQKTSNELEMVEEILSNVNEGMNFSLSSKLLNLSRGKNNEASFDMAYLGLFISVKTEDANFNILEEYGRIHTLIPIAANVYGAIDSSDELNYNDLINALDQKDVETISHVLKDSELIDIVLPVGYDYLGYYLEEEGILEENNISKEMIDSININKDFDQIIDAVAIVLDIVVTENIQFENEEELLEEIFTNEKIANKLQEFVDDVITTSTVQNIGLPFASSYLVELIESSEDETLEELIPLLSAQRLNLYLENDINEIFVIAKDIYSSPLKEIINSVIRGKDLSDINIDFSDPKVTSVVESTLIKLMKLNLVHGNENTIVKVVMKSLFEEYDIETILFDENGNPRIDWSKETDVIAGTLVTLLETFGQDLMINITNPVELILTLLESSNAEDIIATLVESNLIESLVVNFISDFIQNSEDIPDNLKAILTAEALQDCFEEDIVALIHAAQGVYNTEAKEQIVLAIKGEEFDLNSVNFNNADIKESLDNLIITILNLSIIKGNEEVLIEYVISLINEGNENININAQEILYDEYGDKYIDWDEEKHIISNVVTNILVILNGSFGEELEADGYIDLIIPNDNTSLVIEQVTSSSFIQKIIVSMLSQVLESNEDVPSGLKEIFTEEALENAFTNDIEELYKILKDLYNSPLKDAILNTFLKNESFNPDLSNIDNQQTFKNIINRLIGLSIIEGNEEVLIKLLMENIEGIEIDLDSVLYDENGEKYLNWESEINTLCDALIEVINVFGSDFSNFTFEMFEEKLLSDKDKTKNFVNIISESEIVRAVILDMIPDMLQDAEMVPEEILAFFTEEKFEALDSKEAFKEEVNLLLDVIIDILELEITDFDNFEITVEKQPLLKDALNKLIQSSFIKGEEEELVRALVSGIEGIEIDLDSVLYDENGDKYLNWDNEINALCDALFIVLNELGSDFSSFDLELFEEKLLSDDEKTENFVMTVSESEIIRAIILDMIPDIINDSGMLPEEFATFFSKEKFEALEEKEAFQAELILLLDVVGDLLELGITDFSSFEISSENQALLKSALTKLIESTFIKGEEEQLFKLFLDTTNFTGMLEESGITLDYSNVTNWHNELVISIDIALGFVDIATGDEFAIGDLFAGDMSDEEITKVANLFDEIGESELFKPIVYQMISNVGYDIEITDEDKTLIEANGFGNEIKSLLEVIGGAQALLEAQDLTTLKGSDVEELMLTASNGVITSKVVGTLLETALGPDGLNINPLDDNGNPKYDFTEQQTLKDQAKNIANLIDLANSMSSFDINSTTSVTDITTALKGLESNELAEDALKEITGVEVDLESLDIETEATVIENVYEEYKNAVDQENFEPSEELLEQIEESNLAETILGILGIISK